MINSEKDWVPIYKRNRDTAFNDEERRYWQKLLDEQIKIKSKATSESVQSVS